MFSRFLTIILSLSLTALTAQAAEHETRSAAQAIHTTQAPGPTTPAPEAFTEAELQQLAQREQTPGPEVIGGALSNLHLTYIVIALAAAIVVLIAK